MVISKDCDKPYIQSVKLNGKPLNRSYITYEELANGAELAFTMGDKPSETWGKGSGNMPVTRIEPKMAIVPVPVFSTDKVSFQDKTGVAISVPKVMDMSARKMVDGKSKEAVKSQSERPTDAVRMQAVPVGGEDSYEIFYTTDGREPSPKTGIRYTGPIAVDKDVTIKAVAVDIKGRTSKVAEAHYVRYTRDKDLTYVTKPNPQYYAGGDAGLVDNQRGKVNYRIGGWQGFTTDCELVIDLREKKPISRVGAGVLEDQRAWIFFPTGMEVYVSDDGKNFKSFGDTKVNVPRTESAHIQDIEVRGKAEARYVKIVIKNYGKLPEWHLSAGEQAWLFVDEVWVK